jgi:NADP-dependent 3-hydroxy acid dehydrogenase YdfG
MARANPPGPGVLFISGGTSGVGAATALRAATQGFRVFVTGTSRDRLDGVVRAGGGLVAGKTGDASEWADVDAAVDAAVRRFGRIDVAWANAGLGAGGDFQTGDVEQWRRMVLTNTLGPALLLRAALPLLLESRGHFLVTGSVLGSRPPAGSLYAATKASAACLVESARKQLIGTGVRASLLEIGRTDTGWWPDGAPPPALAPGDVADAVLWLIGRPSGVDVGGLLIRPSGQVL